MRSINSNYVVVEKLEAEQKEGFKTVEVQDNFVYKGKIKKIPSCPQYVDNQALEVGNIILFAKYSPDSHEIDGDKFIKTSDILAVL